MPQISDLNHRTKSLTEDVNGLLYKFAHEPSLAGHRIQEHVYKTIPGLVKEQASIMTNKHKIDGTIFDLDYTKEVLSKLDELIHTSAATRETISELASKISAKSTSRTLFNP